MIGSFWNRSRVGFWVLNVWSLGQPPSYGITLRTKMHTELSGVHGVHFREASGNSATGFTKMHTVHTEPTVCTVCIFVKPLDGWSRV
jgi:hypothetical protein